MIETKAKDFLEKDDGEWNISLKSSGSIEPLKSTPTDYYHFFPYTFLVDFLKKPRMIKVFKPLSKDFKLEYFVKWFEGFLTP